MAEYGLRTRKRKDRSPQVNLTPELDYDDDRSGDSSSTEDFVPDTDRNLLRMEMKRKRRSQKQVLAIGVSVFDFLLHLVVRPSLSVNIAFQTLIFCREDRGLYEGSMNLKLLDALFMSCPLYTLFYSSQRRPRCKIVILTAGNEQHTQSQQPSHAEEYRKENPSSAKTPKQSSALRKTKVEKESIAVDMANIDETIWKMRHEAGYTRNEVNAAFAKAGNAFTKERSSENVWRRTKIKHGIVPKQKSQKTPGPISDQKVENRGSKSTKNNRAWSSKHDSHLCMLVDQISESFSDILDAAKNSLNGLFHSEAGKAVGIGCIMPILTAADQGTWPIVAYKMDLIFEGEKFTQNECQDRYYVVRQRMEDAKTEGKGEGGIMEDNYGDGSYGYGEGEVKDE
ncbi:MAG: hypothetical protein MMC33_009970 [Icmadophila ericetorum]|nr:hypothetical protein [Icmadophila ericetorum]